MRRVLSISVLLAALGCGNVEDRPACGVSTDCPLGQTCARAGGEAVCWPDASPPVVSAVTVSCASPCPRDSVLRVEATVADDVEVLDAQVSLDLGAGPVAMRRSGEVWVADVDLAAYPFHAFSRTVVATVSARDGARNPSNAASAAPVAVTRLRWTFDAGAPITSPAVTDDGTAVVGVSASSGQVLAVRADGTVAWSLDVGGTAWVSAVPAIGASAIWVGSEDFNLYGLELDGSGVKAGVGVMTDGAIKGSVAVLPEATKEWGFVASASGRLGAASTVANEFARSGLGDACMTGPVIGLDGRIYAATATATATATLRSFDFDGALTPRWTTEVGVAVSAPLAVDGSGNIWTGSQDAKLVMTTPSDLSGTAITVRTLPGSIVDSPVILADGDVVVGDQTGLLHRLTSAGAPVWTPPNLGAAVLAPLALAGGDAALLVPTAGGRLFALRGDGIEEWSATLDAGRALRAANLHTPAGQAGQVLSTAYVASASGKLFAVIVDGALDAAAPWPKAFHDRRNTNRAGPQP